MPDAQRQGGNSQTLCVELPDLNYITVEQAGGHAMVVRFRLHNHEVKLGDVLLVLDGADIMFHGMIGNIDQEGWAVAADRRGSTLPSNLH